MSEKEKIQRLQRDWFQCEANIQENYFIITYKEVRQLKHSIAAYERHESIHNAILNSGVHSSRSCLNNDSDDVSFIGSHLWLFFTPGARARVTF